MDTLKQYITCIINFPLIKIETEIRQLHTEDCLSLVPNMSWKQYSDYQSKMAMTNHVSKLIKHSYTQTSFLS